MGKKNCQIRKVERKVECVFKKKSRVGKNAWHFPYEKLSEVFKAAEGFSFCIHHSKFNIQPLLHRHTLRQIPRLVNIQAAQRSDMIRQHLQGDHGNDWAEHPRGTGRGLPCRR